MDQSEVPKKEKAQIPICFLEENKIEPTFPPSAPAHDQAPKIRMLECFFALSSKSSTSSPLPNHSQEEATPSPNNVSREYNLTVNANSYTEIRSMVQAIPESQQQFQLLHPNRERVQQALSNTKKSASSHTRLISKYFDHSETASTLCLNLLQRAQLARATYAPLLHLLQPQPNPNHAFPLFLEFHAQNNPLPNSHSFTDIRGSLSELKSQLDRRRLRRSRSVLRVFRRVSDRRRGQLDAAAKCAYVLNNDLGTIDRLVVRLCAAVEGDKVMVRLGLERGNERFPIEQVVKQLGKSYDSFLHQLEDLEEHVCLCFYTVNKARTLLLQEICSSFP